MKSIRKAYPKGFSSIQPHPRYGGRGCSILLGLPPVLVLIASFLVFAGEVPIWWERAETIARKEGYRLIDKKQLKALYAAKADFVVIDVRPDYEYDAGHLPEAVRLEVGLEDRSSLSPLKRKQFEKIVGSDPARAIVIYCKDYG